MQRRNDEQGVALVLTLIFAILLYILLAELVVSGRMVRATGENDVLLARMRAQMEYQRAETERELLEDLQGQTGGGEGAGAGPLGAAMPGSGAPSGEAGAPGAAGGEGEEDPSAACDSSRDAWFNPVGKPDGDLTTYVWVEDENRKLNVLALWSPDEKFAEFSRDRMVRLIDTLREDTDFDVTSTDAERIVRDLLDWAKRQGSDQLPKPKLKSDDKTRSDLTLLPHLDELLMLPSVTEDLFFDKVYDGKVILGLESVLTVWTSLQMDPGDPAKVQRQRARAQAEGKTAEGEAAPPPANEPRDPNAPAPQPEGLGIRVNINTAPRPVLRALFPTDKISDQVIDAIVKFRNEEEEPKPGEEEETPTDPLDFGEMKLGEEMNLKFFAEPGDLEQIPEFANIPDPQLKADFLKAITTKSDVFSIHFATMFKRNEENRAFVLSRSRSVVVRRDNGSDGYLHPLVLFEERHGLRLQPIDLQDETIDRSHQYREMDEFSQEERAWNPFLVDFYLPQHQREEFYRPRERR